MKFTLLMIVACFQVSGAGLAQTISISERNASLTEIFEEINRQTGYEFLYDSKLIALAHPVSISVKDSPIEEVLSICFHNQPLTYEISEKTIVVKPLPSQQKNSTDTPDNVQFQITGTVTDKDGEIMPGVNVIVKGTGTGTSTDDKGKFFIQVNDNDILVFSFIGYKSEEIRVDGRTVIDVSLEQDILSLGEVEINAGYYTTTDKTRTGNIAKISAEIIEKQPVTNLLQALQGRVSGVIIEQQTGLPGGGISIQVRGRNSIRPGTGSPLFVVDGVPYSSDAFGVGTGLIMQNNVSPLNSLNPSDIESIEILKDADATAIYGSRGANGVVLIATRKAKASRTSIDINFSAGFGQVGNYMDLLNTSQYLQMKKEALKNSGRWDNPNLISHADIFVWDTTRHTDWQKELIGGTAKTSNTRIAISGGSAKTQFLFQGSYHREGSVFPGDFMYQKGSGLLNITHSSEDDKFTLTSSVNFAVDVNELPSEDLTQQAISLAPTAPALFDENGNINWENNTWYNPMAAFLKRKFRAAGDNLNTNVNLKYEIIPGLSVKSNLGHNRRHFDSRTTIPYSSFRPDVISAFQASSTFGNGVVATWIVEPQLEFTQSIRKGTLILLAGSSFQESKRNYEVKSGTGFSSDALLDNIKAATDVTIAVADFYQYRYAALFGRLNYNWDEKYILNLTARRDGSSRFGPDRKFGNFGALGAAWIFSSEKFITDRFSFLHFGKLRTSFGITGSDNIGNYQYLDSYNPTENPYQGTTGLVPSRLANNDYGWETNKKFEAAIEVGLFDSRIYLSTSYYRNRSSNQLVGYALPVITGQPSVQRNLPATVENVGWEFELNTENLNGAVVWTTDFNLTIPRNKLVEYPGLESSPYAFNYVVGQPLNIRQGFRYTGVDILTGYYTFEDLNEDGQVTLDDYQIVGKVGADYFLGMNNSIKFKGLQLDIHFQAVKQKTGPSYYNFQSFGPPGQGNSNQPTIVMNRWVRPGDVTDIQKFDLDALDLQALLYQSDRSITDASFIRLKNVQLSWHVPAGWANKLKMQSASAFIQCQNLLTITNYLGLDPESQDSRRLPPLRTITMGVNISF